MKTGPKPRHGHTGYRKKPSKMYSLWRNMRTRCRSQSSASYKYYGARGISVCDRWGLFDNFLADVVAEIGNRPRGPGWSLDRKDTDGNYEPGNIRWAQPKGQARNRRSTRLTQKDVDDIRQEYIPRRIPARVFAERYGVSVRQVLSIVKNEKWT